MAEMEDPEVAEDTMVMIPQAKATAEVDLMVEAAEVRAVLAAMAAPMAAVAVVAAGKQTAGMLAPMEEREDAAEPAYIVEPQHPVKMVHPEQIR